MVTVTVQGRLAYSAYVEVAGIRLAIAEIKNVEYLLEGNPPPPRGWQKDEEKGIATGPMLVLGTEVAALMTADMAEGLAQNLIDAAKMWRETVGKENDQTT